jgi:hypothetical protein
MRPPVRKAPEPRDASQPHRVSHPIEKEMLTCAQVVEEWEIGAEGEAVPEM